MEEFEAANPKNWANKILEDEFLRLEILKPQDFENLFAVASDPLIWEQHPVKNRFEETEFRTFFDQAILERTSYLVKTKENEQVIGSSRFYGYLPAYRALAVGFTFLSRNFWGGKANLHLKKLMLNEAFKHVDTIYFHVGIENTRSQIAIKRLGAELANDAEPYKTDLTQNSLVFLLPKSIWGSGLGCT